MKNKLTDLNDHMFAQLERLGDEELTPEQLAIEIDRTDAITDIAKQVISNAQLMLDAHVKKAGFIDATQSLPELLSVEHHESN